MDLKYRRIIYISFIALFMVSAIGVLLYAQGYKYNSLKKRVEKTGAITIVSDPTGALVRITQQTAEGYTPLKWNRLAPDQYDVTVNLAGYQEWKKKLTVKSGQVTASDKIKLWPSTNIGQILPDTSQTETWQSPNKQNLLYLSTKGLSAGLWMLNLVSGDSALINRQSSDQINYLEWSPSSRQVLLNLKNSGWQILSLTDNTTVRVTLPPTISPTTMHWSSSDSEKVFFSTATELYELNLASDSARLLARENISDFREHQGLLYILSRQSNDGVTLKILNPKNLQFIPPADPFPVSANYTFLEQKNDRLPLLDTGRHNLYLLQSPLKSSQPVVRLPDVLNIDWSPDGQKLIYYNNFEIWRYDLAEDKNDLLYRVSSLISGARWYNDEYILFSVAEQLIALELDSRDSQQSWQLSNQASEIENIYLEPEGKIITLHNANGLIRISTTVSPSQSSEPPVDWLAKAIQKFPRLSKSLEQS